MILSKRDIKKMSKQELVRSIVYNLKILKEKEKPLVRASGVRELSPYYNENEEQLSNEF